MNQIVELLPNVWIMDDHQWAYYIWNNFRKLSQRKKDILVHLDWHWDGVNDFHNSAQIDELERANQSQDYLKALIEDNSLIKFDSFIAPAVISGYFKELYFHCYQNEVDAGLDANFLQKYHTQQYIFNDLKCLIETVGKDRVFLDFDIDIFNRNMDCMNPDIWTEVEIRSFLTQLSGLVKNAQLITIARSPVFCGSEENTRFLMDIVIEEVGKLRQSYC